MVITLLFSSVLGSAFGVGLGLYWGLGGVMIALCYVLGGTIGVTITFCVAFSRFQRQEALHQEVPAQTAPQIASARQNA